jgi:hypothetical protein
MPLDPLAKPSIESAKVSVAKSNIGTPLKRLEPLSKVANQLFDLSKELSAT